MSVKLASSVNAQNILGMNSIPGFLMPQVYDQNLPASRQDMYTVPAGKRAMWYPTNSIVLYNTTGSPITLNIELKVNGSYYPIHKAYSVPANTSVISSNVVFHTLVMEAGESITLTASATGLMAHMKVVEFSASYPVYSPKLLTLANGDNTLYECPTGYRSITIRSATSFGAETLSNQNTINYFNDSDGSRSIQTKFQPNGGSAYATHPAVTVADDTASAMVQAGALPSLVAGDRLIVNTNAATDVQWCYTTVYEYQA